MLQADGGVALLFLLFIFTVYTYFHYSYLLSLFILTFKSSNKFVFTLYVFLCVVCSDQMTSDNVLIGVSRSVRLLTFLTSPKAKG
jgi:hypothetical protein